MSGRVEKTSAMSCLCPPDCCSPDVERDESYVWFLIKVLFFYHFPHILFINLFTNLFLPLLCLFSFFVVRSLFKVLYGQWIIMGSLALPIVARQ